MNKQQTINTVHGYLHFFLGGTKILFFVLILLLLTSCQTTKDGSYSAHVWEDVNGNGVQETSERSLEGIVIQIIDPANGNLWGREITDTQGNVNAFSPGGSCGQYQIYLSIPNGYRPTTRVVVTSPKCEVAQFGLQITP